MGEWDEEILQDIALVNPSETLKKGEKAKKVGMEVLQPFTKRIHSYSIEEYKGGVKFKNGDTLIARITPSLENGKTAFVDFLNENEIGFGSTEFIVLREKENISDKHFLYYLAMSPEFREIAIKSMTGSSGRQRVQTEVVKNHSFFLPPFPEQRAIASVLSSLDDKIDLLRRQNKTLEALAETLFRQWFVEEVEENWTKVTIGDFVKTNVASITKGYNYELIKYMDTSSIKEGRIEGFQIFNLKEAPSRAKRIVKHNDIVISTVRPNQKHYGILRNPDNNLIVSTGFCVISCEDISPYFVYLLLTANEMTEYLHSIAEGSTSAYPSLKPTDIEKIEFQLPPDAKMREFSAFAAVAWDKIDNNYRQIRTLKNMRDTLLPKLMSGEVRVKM